MCLPRRNNNRNSICIFIFYLIVCIQIIIYLTVFRNDITLYSSVLTFYLTICKLILLWNIFKFQVILSIYIFTPEIYTSTDFQIVRCNPVPEYNIFSCSSMSFFSTTVVTYICWLLYPDNNMFTAKVRRMKNIFINMPFVLFLPTRISSDFSIASYIFSNNIQII